MLVNAFRSNFPFYALLTQECQACNVQVGACTVVSPVWCSHPSGVVSWLLVAGGVHSHLPLAWLWNGFPLPQQGHTQPHSTPDSKLFLEEQSFKAEIWKFVIGGVSATLYISTGMWTYRGHGNSFNRFGISVPFFHMGEGRHSTRKLFFHCLAVGVGIFTLCGS